MGHHSTSDDSFAYRPRSEVEDRKKVDNPIVRFRLFLESKGWWDATSEEELKKRHRNDVMKALKAAENAPRPELSELFTDVYGGEEPWNLVSDKSCSPSIFIDCWIAERATRGVDSSFEEVWQFLGTMEEGT